MDRYEGVLGTFFETGCEGTFWVLNQNGVTGYDQHVFLENGDHLTIYDDDCVVVYEGVIKEDRTMNLQQRPFTTIVQPACRGLWLHWLQAEVEPELWCEWFFSNRYKGVLFKGMSDE